jgi:hypothetical protein
MFEYDNGGEGDDSGGTPSPKPTPSPTPPQNDEPIGG